MVGEYCLVQVILGIHGHAWSSMVFYHNSIPGARNSWRRNGTDVAGLDGLNSIIDPQIFVFYIEVILMTVFPELGQSRKFSFTIMNYIYIYIFLIIYI